MSREQARLERVLDHAHQRLGLDAIYLWEFRRGRQECLVVVGDAGSFRLGAHDELPTEQSYSYRMITGQIPNVVCDTRAEPLLDGLAITRDSGIGAYVGVPVRCPQGGLWGALAGVCHRPRPELDQRAVGTLSLLADLIVDDVQEQSRCEDARRDIIQFIDGGGFEVAYQPLIDIGTGRCLGVEALARFPGPYASPAETFASAERVGLGIELELAVLHRALAVLPRLAAGQFLALNISPDALLDRARRATSCVDRLPLPQLVVEVTEHAAIAAYAALRDELAPARERGLRIAVDDAGAGYASLRHILELRPDLIKLDRWLIDGLAEDRARRVAVSSFVSLARELGASVVAEGVERVEDLAAVRELGLNAAQGYLLGRPSVDLVEVDGWCATVYASAGCDHGRPVGVGLGSAAGSVIGPTVGRELERLELDRRVSQRLEAVGQLAAGIAHEINTPLQFVGDSVSFLRGAVDELVALTGLYREMLYSDTPVALAQRREALRDAEERADVEYLCERIPGAFDRTADGIARVRSIVQAMKQFSHAAGTEAAPADINEALQTTLVVCRNEYKYVADVSTDLDAIPDVVCNISELNQVFLNLIVNAAQAIEEQTERGGDRGQITIRTRRRGDSAVIEITDTGPGIPAALLDRIYEPFFTTKPVGKGTGQGLALALATVQRHAGSLQCRSTPGHGTTFTVELPLQATAAPAAPVARAA